jgi:hypothetical protein
MINEVEYNPSLTPVTGAVQIDNILIATGSPDFSTGNWVGGVDDSDGYVIVGDTTSSNLAGWGTGGGTGVAQPNTPTFWKATGRTDNALIALVNKLPGSGGNYTNINDALSFLTSSPFGVINYTGGGAPGNDYTITITQSGNNVVVSGSGTLNLSDLTFVGVSGPVGQGGLGASTSTFIISGNNNYFTKYSGSTINVPANFGSGGGGASSGTGGPVGIIVDGAPPYLVVVPTGYTSGQPISGTLTFNNTTISALGLTEGTYNYTWGSGANASGISMAIGGTSGTSGTGGGSGNSWYFYSDEGPLNAPPPSNNGDAIFKVSGPSNVAGLQLFFYRYDSNGVDYATQFAALQSNGGTLSITQNGQTVTYTTGNPNMFIYTNIGGNYVLMVNTNMLTQTSATISPFVYGDPITLTIS